MWIRRSRYDARAMTGRVGPTHHHPAAALLLQGIVHLHALLSVPLGRNFHYSVGFVTVELQ